MRWNAAPPSGFHGALEAVPVTLLSREEDFHHPLHRQPPTSARRTKTSARGTSAAPRQLSARRTTNTNASANANANANIGEKISLANAIGGTLTKAEITPRSHVDDIEPHTDTSAADKFLVCAGRSLSGESPRTNNNCEDAIEAELGLHANWSVSAAVHTDANYPVTADPAAFKSSRGLLRTDSELELIISELREKISQQQYQHQQHQHQRSENDTKSSNQHSRKHLKNPVEKMSLAFSASASQMIATRLVSEDTVSRVQPAVLSSSSSRNALSGASAQASIRDANELVSLNRPYETEDAQDGFRIRSYGGSSDSSTIVAQFTSSTSLGAGPGTVVMPASTSLETPTPTNHALTTPTATTPTPTRHRLAKPKIRTLADLDVELDRMTANASIRNNNGIPESLSPVGPWAVDDDTPLASSRSTSSLASSSSTAAVPIPSQPPTSELSPRTRLLWLSDCDEVWYTTSARVLAMLRPGVKVGGDRRPASAVDERRRHQQSAKSTKKPTPTKPRAASARPHAPSGARRIGSYHERPTTGVTTTPKNSRPSYRT